MRIKPYQPSLLRVLHGVTALLVLAAIVTGFWVYNTFDGRFGKLLLPRINSMIDIHGTIGLTFLLFVPWFAIYSLWIGRKRLVQKNTVANLARVGEPIWWLSLQRITNTAMLVASAFVLISGKLMDETWLPSGELMHLPYLFHLAAWATMIVCLALHLLMNVKVGGLPLLGSMIDFKVRSDDRPKSWLQQLRKRL